MYIYACSMFYVYVPYLSILMILYSLYIYSTTYLTFHTSAHHPHISSKICQVFKCLKLSISSELHLPRPRGSLTTLHEAVSDPWVLSPGVAKPKPTQILTNPDRNPYATVDGFEILHHLG